MSESADASKRKPLRFKAYGNTDIGLKRPHNEDSVAVSEGLALFAVADGMGGHAAGEVASRTAIDTLLEFVAQAAEYVKNPDFTWPFSMDNHHSLEENIILNGIQLANRKVCQAAAENHDFSGMGTTLALIYAPESKVHICHIGDSRVYRRRGGQLELMTMDHSWVNEQLQRNIITEDEARNHRWRNVITRALGNRLELEVDLKTIDGEPGDLFLLCSDGLSGMLRDEEIDMILGRTPEDLEATCTALIDAANIAGGQDNISVILVQVLPWANGNAGKVGDTDPEPTIGT